jgi:hypothetical protein
LYRKWNTKAVEKIEHVMPSKFYSVLCEGVKAPELLNHASCELCLLVQRLHWIWHSQGKILSSLVVGYSRQKCELLVSHITTSVGVMKELILYGIYVDVCTASSPVYCSTHAGSLQDI